MFKSFKTFNRFAPFKPFMSPAVPIIQTVQGRSIVGLRGDQPARIFSSVGISIFS